MEILILSLLRSAGVGAWFVFGTLLFSSAAANAESSLVGEYGWALEGGIYNVGSGINFVLVNQERQSEKELYESAVDEICDRREWCKVMFWSDEAMIPSNFPMTDPQADSMIANHTQNPASGYSRIMFSCRLGIEPGSCF